MFTVTIPDNCSLIGMVAVQNSPELLQLSKMILLQAANTIAEFTRENELAEENQQILFIVRELIRRDSYREEIAKIFINAGIVRGVFPNIENSYSLPGNIDQVLQDLINVLINDNLLIGMIS